MSRRNAWYQTEEIAPSKPVCVTYLMLGGDEGSSKNQD